MAVINLALHLHCQSLSRIIIIFAETLLQLKGEWRFVFFEAA